MIILIQISKSIKSGNNTQYPRTIEINYSYQVWKERANDCKLRRCRVIEGQHYTHDRVGLPLTWIPLSSLNYDYKFFNYFLIIRFLNMKKKYFFLNSFFLFAWEGYEPTCIPAQHVWATWSPHLKSTCLYFYYIHISTLLHHIS